MSPICGIVSRNNKDVSSPINKMMGILGNKREDGAWVAAGGNVQRGQEETGQQAFLSMGQTSFRTREANMERPVFASGSKLSVLYEGNLYNRGELVAGKGSKAAPDSDPAAGIVACMLDEEYDGNLVKAMKLVASRLNGDYCLAASDGSQIMVMRDPAGVRPLFFGEKDDLVAFSSLKRALWELGFRDVKPLRSGRYIVVDANGISADESWTHLGEGIESSLDDIDAAVEKYCALLKNAVEKRLDNVNRVGVLVSGGVDSCLTAKLVNDVAIDRDIEIVAYTAGVKGSTDIDYARGFARHFDIQHKVRYLTTEDVEYYMPVVINSVEERDMVQVEAGIGVYAALEMARKDGIRLIVSGQGPDELWGGYSWYPRVIASEGYERLEQRMRDDLARADIETLDRENRLAIAHGLEKVFPYVDIDVVKLALSVSPRIKINSEDDNTGKRPHREAAKKLGLPSQYADRGKDAAQHGTGIHDTLEEIAGKHGFSPELVERTGYSSDLISKTKLASSTRYGYQYVEKELWETPGAVQFFIDTIAYKQGLLNEYERTNIEKFMDTSKG